MPCVLLVCQAPYWPKLRPVFELIYKDASQTVKKSLASGLVEMAKIHFDEQFMIQVLTYFATQEDDEIKGRVLPDIVTFFSLVKPERAAQMLGQLVRPILEDQPKKQTMKQSAAKVKLMKQLFT
jgi:hypothetical protein